MFVIVCIHHTTGLTTGCIVYTNIQPVVYSRLVVREKRS